MPKNENDENNSSQNAYVKYSGLGFEMIAIIGIFTYAGYKIDESAHHATKWVTALLSLTGVFVSLYFVIRSVRS